MDGKLVETIHGKRSKFEITRKSNFLSESFFVYEDGKFWTSFSSLDRAVAEAKKRGKVS